jgi:Kef-type K+ transport system membrane component KefB
MILTFLLGFLVSFALGFSILSGIYIGIALAFSSTIIVMKLFSDKKQLDSLHGKISAGILMIQDLTALIILMIISSTSNSSGLGTSGIWNLLIGFLVIVLISIVGFFLIPKITNNLAKNLEILFLFSIVWCFAIIAIFTYFGFSIEIGALIAGIILSVSPYSIEISSKIRPLRDFFLIIFFIILGLSVEVSQIPPIIFYVIIFTIIASVLKPLILMALMASFGYTKRTNFLVGTSLGQVSEFSLILVALGVSLGHISPRIAVIIEKEKIKKERKIEKKYDAILFGYNRIGFGILNSLKKIHRNYLVVDFNPDTISNLKKIRIPCLYGDVYDPDLLEELPLESVKLAVSTIPDFETNYVLIEEIRKINQNAVIIVRAHQIQEALDLYKKGADYVLTPHFLGGEYVSNMIKEEKTDKNAYTTEREKHIKMLKDYASQGHEHPRSEGD